MQKVKAGAQSLATVHHAHALKPGWGPRGRNPHGRITLRSTGSSSEGEEGWGRKRKFR